MTLSGCKINLPTISEKDKEDIYFGLRNGIDIIAISFVKSAKDIEEIKELLGPKANNINLISKIQNKEGLDNFDEILFASDGIMIARGELGMEIKPEKIFKIQKDIIKKCNILGKPVITASQMLESMITNPRPTRAEATDVANAVLDGTDSVLLSCETANGLYPVEAVETMAKVNKIINLKDM